MLSQGPLTCWTLRAPQKKVKWTIQYIYIFFILIQGHLSLLSFLQQQLKLCTSSAYTYFHIAFKQVTSRFHEDSYAAIKVKQLDSQCHRF